MKLIDSYLNIIQKEYGYENPIQTRPRPKPGITGEDPDKPLPPGVRGPSGSQVDLDNDEEVGFDFRNFAQADYNFDGNKKPSKKKNET
jgi:hypothetical protein